MNVTARLRGALAGVLLATLAGVGTAGERDAAEAGRLRFETDCALCHGPDARGNGPFAALLNVTPPDLTGLARANGGRFPFSGVYRSIDGRDRPLAHGTEAMPVWGRRWKAEGGEETWVRGRVLELILYLESVQEP